MIDEFIQFIKRAQGKIVSLFESVFNFLRDIFEWGTGVKKYVTALNASEEINQNLIKELDLIKKDLADKIAKAQKREDLFNRALESYENDNKRFIQEIQEAREHINELKENYRILAGSYEALSTRFFETRNRLDVYEPSERTEEVQHRSRAQRRSARSYLRSSTGADESSDQSSSDSNPVKPVHLGRMLRRSLDSCQARSLSPSHGRASINPRSPIIMSNLSRQVDNFMEDAAAAQHIATTIGHEVADLASCLSETIKMFS